MNKNKFFISQFNIIPYFTTFFIAHKEANRKKNEIIVGFCKEGILCACEEIQLPVQVSFPLSR